jgi:beta-RFAP synthase
MVDRPGVWLRVDRSDEWSARGPHAERVLEIARRAAERMHADGRGEAPRGAFEVVEAPPAHVGLGTGTQLSAAVSQCVWSLAGGARLEASALAGWSGRGLRSGIGIHGFVRGGLIVDGGKRGGDRPPPLLARLPVPPHWNILVAIPALGPGTHGQGEADAFEDLADVPDGVVDRMCRLVLLGILPAVAEADLETFGAALSELQRHVGAIFAAAQGGRLFGHPVLEDLVAGLGALGLRGVGQSSWGPAVYGFTDRPTREFERGLGVLRERLGLNDRALIWTTGSVDGAIVHTGARPHEGPIARRKSRG